MCGFIVLRMLNCNFVDLESLLISFTLDELWQDLIILHLDTENILVRTSRATAG